MILFLIRIRLLNLCLFRNIQMAKVRTCQFREDDCRFSYRFSFGSHFGLPEVILLQNNPCGKTSLTLPIQCRRKTQERKSLCYRLVEEFILNTYPSLNFLEPHLGFYVFILVRPIFAPFNNVLKFY